MYACSWQVNSNEKDVNRDKKKGPQNVAIPEALFYVAIQENHFRAQKSTHDRMSAIVNVFLFFGPRFYQPVRGAVMAKRQQIPLKHD